MVLICYLSERRSEKLNGLINVRLIVQHVTETVFFVYHQTTWKISKYRGFPGPYFSVFGLNFLYILRKSP